MALVILNMPAMPWHRLFTAEHPEAKQRFPFKAKSHYENPEEKVSLACRVHSSFLLLLNKLLVTFKNRTKMKKEGQKCCQRHFMLCSPLRPAQQPSPGANPRQERGRMKLKVRGGLSDWNGDCLKNLSLLPFLRPWGNSLTAAICEQLHCMLHWDLSLLCTALHSFPSHADALFCSFPILKVWASRICVLGVLMCGFFS